MSRSVSEPDTSTPALSIRELAKEFKTNRRRGKAVVRAVDNVSLDVRRGETLGIVGESGCGKSTLGRMMAGLEPPTSGSIQVSLAEPEPVKRRRTRRVRPVQMVFQDSQNSLNPRMRVGDAVAEAIRLNGGSARGSDLVDELVEIFESVGLNHGHLRRYPHELSGGQQQRVGIARALACQPQLLVEDEPTSALDVSVQAKLVNLLRGFKEDGSLTQVFISHDLAIVGYLADRVAVMYLGQIVEIGPTAAIFDHSRHPYTQALLAAAPVDDLLAPRERIVLAGEVPSPLDAPRGCPFSTRCPFVVEQCRDERQVLAVVGEEHSAACWRAAAGEIPSRSIRSGTTNDQVDKES